MEKQRTAQPSGVKLLIFSLNGELYGIDILKVREIIAIQEITKIPNAPRYIKGIINLRGQIIPVIDLRLKLGFPEREYDSRTCIVVVEVKIDNEEAIFGLIVDRALEVISLSEAEIERDVKLGKGKKIEYIDGIGKTGEKVYTLININKIVNLEEIEKVKE